MKLFLTGCQGGRIYGGSLTEAVAKMPPKRIGFLESYAGMTSTERARFFYDPNTVNFELVVDSGAYTFQRPKMLLQKDKFAQLCQGYLAYALEGKDRCLWFAEMDIDVTAGTAWVEAFTEKLESTGATVMRVWHPCRGLEAFKTYCAKYKYLGISYRDIRKDLKLYGRMGRYAYDQGVKLHGFGVTDFRKLQAIPFYSVDSSSNIFPMVQRRYCRHEDFSRLRRGFRYAKLGETDPNILAAHAAPTVNERAAIVMARQYEIELMMTEFVTEYWKKRGVDYD